MHTSIATAVAVIATTVSAQSSLSYWFPGPQNNPSRASQLASQIGLTEPTLAPTASILTSNPSTTIFTLGCPSPSPVPTTLDSSTTLLPSNCPLADVEITYSLISATHYEAHISAADDVQAAYTCDYASPKLTCTVEQKGGNDDTGGPQTWVFPDEAGNVVAFATAEVGGGSGLMTASGSAPVVTGGVGGVSVVETKAATATEAASASATPSTGAAAGWGVEGRVLGALVGAAAVVAW